jgi:hypothetical protein
MLFEGFDVSGIHVEYWMLVVVLIAGIAVGYVTR